MTMMDPEQLKKAKSTAAFLIRLAEKAALGILLFLAAFVFTNIIRIDRRMAALEVKVNDDLSQWNQLKQHEERLMDLEIQITVMRELEKMKRELEKRPLPPVPQPDDDDDTADKPEKAAPPIQEELLKKLEELKRKESLEDYRNRHMMEQRQAPPNIQAPRK
jgi:hypothetical protein